jgi:hypothetical protein
MRKYALIFSKTLALESYNSKIDRIYFHTRTRGDNECLTGFLFSYGTEDTPIDHNRICMRFFYDIVFLIIQKKMEKMKMHKYHLMRFVSHMNQKMT